jgi:hypothetical protein
MNSLAVELKVFGIMIKGYIERQKSKGNKFADFKVEN